ncbi:MAG: KAP family NTPase, partial [Micrococcales bacterium]|nr:KAP family NTPase [Micrococcales bacterium]
MSGAAVSGTDGDLLNRDEAARGIARLILDLTPPFVVGIDGEWGSGKSSLMNMVSDELHSLRNRSRARDLPPAWNRPGGSAARLREQFPARRVDAEASWAAGRVVVVRVNLWEHQHDEVPAVALLQAARDTLPPGARHEATDEIKEILRAGVVDAASVSGVPLGGPAAGANLGAMRQAVLRGRADRFAIQERQGQLSDRFTTVIDEVRRVHGADRVVFVLDDLDRCLPAVALDLLEKVHLLFRATGCVTVIGIDTRVLELTVAQRHREQGAKDEDPDDSRRPRNLAEEYVEKVFDFSYRIPPVNESDFGRFVTGKLNRLRRTPASPATGATTLLDPVQLEQIAELFTTGLVSAGASLRRATRLVSSFIVYHSIKCNDSSTDPRRTSWRTRITRACGRVRGLVSGRSVFRRRRPAVVTGGEPVADALAGAPSPDVGEPPQEYYPFLMAAVTAVLVLYRDDYRRLSTTDEHTIKQWFSLEDSPARLDGSAGTLQDAIKLGTDQILDQLRPAPLEERRQDLVEQVKLYVQMMVGPRQTVTFGHYQGRALTWRVLRTDAAGRQLLLCEDIVRLGPYHRDWGMENDPVTWQKCDLRRWLNGRPSAVSDEHDWEQWAPPDEAYRWDDGRRKMSGAELERYWPTQCFLEGFSADEVARIHPVTISTEDEEWSADKVRKYEVDTRQNY